MENNTCKTQYPSGCFNLVERNIKVETASGEVYYIIPQSVDIGDDRKAVALIKAGQIFNGRAIKVQEITISGKVQITKAGSKCRFEIAAQFKGVRIHMPFEL